MIEFFIVEISTGKITRSGFSMDPRADQVLEPGEGLVEGVSVDPAYYHLSGDGITPIPDRPPGWVEWDGEAWIDPRTSAERQAALYAAREAASLDKSDLLIRMAMAGMLPPEDAEIAAGGIIPPTIQAALDALPPEVFPPEAQMIARIKWRSDTVISRVNPVIVLAAAALGITETQMDAIFDVRIPEGP